MTWLLVIWLCSHVPRWGECRPAPPPPAFASLGDCRRARLILRKADHHALPFCVRLNRIS